MGTAHADGGTESLRKVQVHAYAGGGDEEHVPLTKDSAAWESSSITEDCYGCYMRQHVTAGPRRTRSKFRLLFNSCCGGTTALMMLVMAQGLLLVVLVPLTVAMWRLERQADLRPSVVHDIDVGCGAFPLGTDPSGFVPAHIGYPMKWVKWDETDDFWISPATFDTWEGVLESSSRLRAVHNDVFVYANGQKATYLSYDDERKELPTEAHQFGLELYGIHVMHHIHCVYVLLEDVGFRRYNRTSQWHGEHVAHCLNTLTQAVTCLADSRPFGYVIEGGHRTDGQQNWCRDFSALRKWVNEPDRDHNFFFERDSNGTDHFRPIYRNGTVWGGDAYWLHHTPDDREQQV